MFVALLSAFGYESGRPATDRRRFISGEVEGEIERVQSLLVAPKLAWMFSNCFPNTLDSTVDFKTDRLERPETFVITGDIPSMWLRDSSAQIWPYLQFITRDEDLRLMVEGLIRKQLESILIDPYANAFNAVPDPEGIWIVAALGMAAEIKETVEKVNGEVALTASLRELAAEVSGILRKYAEVGYPEFGKIYAYGVVGFGNALMMDNANIPSLLSLPYISDIDADDEIYRNTRRFVWSDSNPYFFKGQYG